MTSWEIGEISQQEPPPATNQKRPQHFREILWEQFREVVRALTQRPAPRPKPGRRRTESADRGFRAIARSLVRRVFESGCSNGWDTVLWMHLWEYNTPVQYEFLATSDPGEPGLSAHLRPW